LKFVEFFAPVALVLVASTVSATESIQAIGYTWSVDQSSDWTVENNALRLLNKAEPAAGKPRRPTKIALVESASYRKVTIDADVKRNGKSVILVYGWQDADHYNYAHISSDEASKVRVHNGMFHVFGGDRVRMSGFDGPASLPTPDWTPVRLVFDGDTGLCYVEVNGQRNPSLEAVDMDLKWGRVGFGSFNETGDIRNLKITGELREPSPSINN